MLMMTGIPTADILDYIFSGIKIGIASIELNAILYLLAGGWVDVLRSICFFIDSLLVNFIGTFFNYFIQIINGTIFTEETINSVMNRLYIFVGIFVFFKLSIVIIKYINNPELVSDAKAGVNSLIKRVIFGFALIMFIPTIFSMAMDLQEAIIADKVIEKVILSEKDYLDAEKSKDKMGSVIGMNILQGFLNLNSSASRSAIREYNKAIEQSDPSAIGNINSGKVLGLGEYNYNYFPIISTVVLGYTLYLIVKFCIDVALRGFKLGFLQMMAPIAVVDYITGGAEEGSFKNWLKVCKGTYLMLFIRVLSLWFVMFVTILMQKKGDDSLLYIPKGGEPDYLLRAIIILALLAFMMELPKLLSEIFGLDLEQDSTVKGLMKSVMGGFTTVAGVGLAAGGAAIGGIFGAAKGVSKGIANKDDRQVLGALGGNAGGILKAGLGHTKLGGALIGGISSGYGSSTKSASEEHAKTKEQDAKQQAAEQRREDILRDTVKSQAQNNPNASKAQIVDSVLDTQVMSKLGGADPHSIGAKISSDLTATANGQSIETKDVVQKVHQVLGSGLDVSQKDTTQIVNQVLGTTGTATPQQMTQIVDQVVATAKNNMTPEVTQVVNQVMGNVVANPNSSSTQTINQVQGSTVSSQAGTATQTVNQVQGSAVSSQAGTATQTVNQVQGSTVSSQAGTTTQTVNQVQGSAVSSQAGTATQTVEYDVPDSLLGDIEISPRIATKDSDGELRTNFHDNTDGS